VTICSYTTIIGYASLFLSQNLGIQSFGEAAVLGEVACLAVAVFLAPALLWATAPAPARRRSEVSG
jgi:predicted RND superfamily exporter protein